MSLASPTAHTRTLGSSLLAHVQLVLAPTLRDRVQWVHLLLVVPLSSMVPFFLMIKAFAGDHAVDDLFYTNLAWGFTYFAVTQSFLHKDLALRTSRFDTLLVAPAPVWTWLVGSTIGVNLVFLASTSVGLLLLTSALGVPVELARVSLLLALTFLTNVAISTFVFALQIRLVQAFHVLNLSLDAVQALSGVLYPIAALPLLLTPLSWVLPTTWLNELVREGSGIALVAWGGLCALLGAAGMAMSTRAIADRRKDGGVGRA